MSELLHVELNINNEQEYNEAKEEFKNNFNLDIIEEIKPILDDSLIHDSQFPLNVMGLLFHTLPKYLGKKGTKFFLYLFDTGNFDEIDWDDNIKKEFEFIAYRYHIQFKCAQLFPSNPYDYAVLQYFSGEDGQRNHIRIIRADQESFDLNLDIDSLNKLAADLLAKINQSVEAHQIHPSEENRRLLLYQVHKYMLNLGIIEENEDGPEED